MVTMEDFKKIELVVARIKEAKEHPNADRLYVLQVDTGRDVRQIVAGIRKAYSAQDLINRQIILIANMEPAVIRGEVSNGMLLAASNDEGMAILMPDKEIAVGSVVK
jgi:methionyl-tRNA synthetase